MKEAARVKGGFGLGGGVGEIEGGRGGRYGVLQLLPDDWWKYRWFLQEVQEEVGLGV